MRNKKLLTWSLVISSVLLLFLVLAGWVIYSFFTKYFAYLPETPPELRQPRIVVGAEFLVRNRFLTANQLTSIFDPSKDVGTFEDLAVGELDSQLGIDIVIAGRDGAMIVDRNGLKRSQVQYEFEVEGTKIGVFDAQSIKRMLGDIQVIDIEGDGTCEYLARGSLDGAAVFSHEGKRLWSYGKYADDEKAFIDDLAAGDINGDGVAEFIAGWNGLELFNKDGNKVWTQPWEGPLHQIEVVDVDRDRKNEIVHSDGDLVIRNGLGEIVKQVEMPFYLGSFHLCGIPGQEERYILAVADDHLWLTDFNGKVVKKFAAPLSRFSSSLKPPSGNLRDFVLNAATSVYRAKGAWVKLKEAEPEFLAVITEFAAIDRSVLYIYSTEGRLVYQEVLPEKCISIAVLSPEAGRSTQELLIGGTETVWRYSAR